MYFYADNPQPLGHAINVWRMNANKAYLRHYDNLLALHFFADKGNFAERQQAEKEMVICKRKLTFWERHPNFDWASVLPEIEKRNKQWGFTPKMSKPATPTARPAAAPGSKLKALPQQAGTFYRSEDEVPF